MTTTTTIPSVLTGIKLTEDKEPQMFDLKVLDLKTRKLMLLRQFFTFTTRKHSGKEEWWDLYAGPSFICTLFTEEEATEMANHLNENIKPFLADEEALFKDYLKEISNE